MKMPVDKALDALSVKRWSLVDTTAQSTVADHSFAVAIIAMAIRKRMMNNFDCTEQEVCYFAILHDIREVLTCDMPTPVKIKMREAGFDPEDLFPDIQKEEQPSPRVRQIVKLADLISNYHFISEYGAGTRARAAAAEVDRRLRDALAAAPEDMADAARWVLGYVQQRRSDEEGERSRFAEDNKRSSTAIPYGVPSVLDRITRNSTGSA